MRHEESLIERADSQSGGRSSARSPLLPDASPSADTGIKLPLLLAIGNYAFI